MQILTFQGFAITMKGDLKKKVRSDTEKLIRNM